jgi:hypothetical protein
MSTQPYSVTPPPIDTLLAWVKSGGIAIPEIQHPLVWESTKGGNLLLSSAPTGRLYQSLGQRPRSERKMK